MAKQTPLTWRQLRLFLNTLSEKALDESVVVDHAEDMPLIYIGGSHTYEEDYIDFGDGPSPRSSYDPADITPEELADATVYPAGFAYLSGFVPERSCRVCGCTENDCSQCIEATGQPCSWVEWDLCSRCSTFEARLERTGITVAIELPTKVTPEMSYQAGYECGLKGTTLQNSHFSYFANNENTRQWNAGRKAGQNEKGGPGNG